MSVHRHARPRSRRSALHLEYDTQEFRVWLPTADDPLVIASFGDAASLAFELVDWDADREVLVLLDEQRRVTAMLVDPPPPVGVLVGSCDVPGLEVDFCQTLSIVTAVQPEDGPPPDHHRDGYFALRRLHMLQGIQLLDVILAGPERVQSLAIACDPDPIWFEDWQPMAS
ncbi:MAG: hypothetical protein R2713_15310 [Ilumatobacteraceae bacterium]|nr:hypothetical protein [Acidimicrobiales bacterium]MCB9392516.1 hypothetical protein [Acidimicrobiaceae bacterium]